MEDLKIVGWISYDSECENFPLSDDNIESTLVMVIRDIKKNGYKFSGEEHQGIESGVPFFSNGKCLRCSMREWGHLMAIAWEGHHEKYMNYYMSVPGETKYPESGDFSKDFIFDDPGYIPLLADEDMDVIEETLACGASSIFTTDKAVEAVFPLYKEEYNNQ